MKNTPSVSEPQNTVIRGSHVLHHSYVFVENFNTSPSEFYSLVEGSLKEKQVPGLEASRIEWNEGGPLSCKRQYLRLSRECLTFDICAAPFGTGFFFSSRFCYNAPAINIFALLAVNVVLGIIYLMFTRFVGFFLGSFAFCLGIVFGIWLLRNSVSLGLSELDDTLMKIPLLGPIYERFFRKETYFRIDTRIMYRETVPAAVQDVIEQVTGSKGIRLASVSNKSKLPEIVPEPVAS